MTSIFRHGIYGILIFAASLASAEVSLPAMFGDHMVLQRDMEIPVWGTAAPGEKVTVTLDNKSASGIADDQGRWMLKIGPLSVGNPLEMKVDGKNSIVFHDVVVGEVWLCSGQSNMSIPVKSAANAEQEIAQANDPMIRLFTVPTRSTEKPLSDFKAQWISCDPKVIDSFSAVSYFFGRELRKEVKVPIGLIQSSLGGTLIDAWTRKEALESDAGLKQILERWSQRMAALPEAMSKYQSDMADWRKLAAEAKAKGGTVPPEPVRPAGPTHPLAPSGLYNGMIAPLVPYAIRGIIWYQGESNARMGAEYQKHLPLMIQDWRQVWGEGDFPFLIVQLANFTPVVPEPYPRVWAELREAQLKTLSLPKTALVVTVDIGEADNIHPKNKQEVGRRLALAAQAVAYGKQVVYSGPIYDSMLSENGQMKVKFKHAGGGLISQNNEPLKGFIIAGDDHKFVDATAKIDGDTVIVNSDQIAKPAAVRYGWTDNPTCNLYNKEGLPASPFRTDGWARTTVTLENYWTKTNADSGKK